MTLAAPAKLWSLAYRIATNPVVIAAFLAIALVVGNWYKKVGRDQGIWTYIGWAWQAKGVAPLSGAIENKPPGIYLLYAVSTRFSGVTTWFHAIAGTMALVAAARSSTGWRADVQSHGGW